MTVGFPPVKILSRLLLTPMTALTVVPLVTVKVFVVAFDPKLSETVRLTLYVAGSVCAGTLSVAVVQELGEVIEPEPETMAQVQEVGLPVPVLVSAMPDGKALTA